MLPVLILINIILFVFALTFIFLGGVFQCTVSVSSQMIGFLITILSFLFAIGIHISINNNSIKQILPVILPFIITVIEMSLVTKLLYDRQHKLNRKKVNPNYHVFNGWYKLNISLIILLHILHFLFLETISSFFEKIIFYFQWILSILGVILSYFVRHYLNL